MKKISPYIQVNRVNAGISEESWKKAVSHVIKFEDNYWSINSITEENIKQCSNSIQTAVRVKATTAVLVPVMI
jgi:hypothetical protein